MVSFTEKEVFIFAFLLALMFMANPNWIGWSIWVFSGVVIAFILNRFGVFTYIRGVLFG